MWIEATLVDEKLPEVFKALVLTQKSIIKILDCDPFGIMEAIIACFIPASLIHFYCTILWLCEIEGNMAQMTYSG